MLKYMRHDLVWLAPECLKDSSVYVVTRQTCARGFLNIACAINHDKSPLSRKSFVVPLYKIICHQRPVLLIDIIRQHNWLNLYSLIQQFEAVGVTLRVYGSFAWQYLTNQEYITANSDIDILFYINSLAIDIGLLHKLILELESLCQYSLDGELVLPSGIFISWREWFNNDTRVLVKTTDKAPYLSAKDLLWKS